MKLHQAFDIKRGDTVAFIGAGGKTSTLVALGHELAEMGWRVIATTTTRIGEDQLRLFPQMMQADTASQIISDALTTDGFVFLYDSIRDGKVYGPDPQWIPKLMDAVDSDIILVEADGARGLYLKSPFPHEPVIPPDTSLVVPIASLKALGQPLTDEYVYNLQPIIERYGYHEGNRIKSPWIAEVLRDDMLGLQGVPQNVRIIAFLNGASSKGYGRARARLIAKLTLRQPRIHGVAIGSTRSSGPIFEIQRPVGAVVLAAGLSTRMGQPKVLMPWADGKTIIEHIIEQLIRSRIDYITVVTGHMAAEVKALVKPMGVKVVFNRSYKTGEMLSSVKVGLRSMPDNIAASLIVLGDQPRLDPKTIYKILTAYSQGKSDIIAPSYKMRRGHPILIGRRLWPELFKLKRNGAPRDVINAHNQEIHYIKVDTDSVLRDVDTIDDYTNERWRAGLTDKIKKSPE